MLETTSSTARTSAAGSARALWWNAARPRRTGAAPAAVPAAPWIPSGAWKSSRRNVRRVGVPSTTVGRVGHGHRPARTRRDVERERPLVVARRAPVGADRGFRALAAHAHHPAGGRHVRLKRRVVVAAARLSGARSGRPWRRSSARRSSARRSSARRSSARRIDSWLLASDPYQLELATFGHRVLVLLTKEPALDEGVDTGRERVWDVRVLVPEERNRPRVLLSAKDELGFFLAAGLVPPDRHRDREQNSHDGERDQQGRHRVSAFRVLTA
jgi:hypothetical protein